MIITKLKGGLGNQLFQYSITRSLSTEYSTEFFFDVSYYNKTKNGDLYLNKFFNTKLPLWQGKCKLPKIIDTFSYQLISNNVYLAGWWQSEKYFKKYRDIILDDLKFSEDTVEYVTKKYSFLTENTVSMHVRRGDYVTKQDQYPFPGIKYYNDGYDYINDPNIKVIVFSDDIEWCKNNINFKNVKYIENETDLVDLCIMSLCKHNIICNSSYSWWGAWLNKNTEKIVVAPNIWFGPALQQNDSDIVPETWKKM